MTVWTRSKVVSPRPPASSPITISAEFYYDGKNRQIARKIGGVIRFSAWDAWELLEEYAGGMQRTEAYLQGGAGVIKTLVTNRYYYQDKLGSTTHLADGSGALLESYRYDLYGTPTYYDQNGQLKANQVSEYGVNDLYAGERWVSELRVYDLRNRFMSPELGRFLQADPIRFKGDASNLYRYCGNDPIDRTDPTGLVDTSAGSNLWRNLMNFYVGNPSMNEILAEWTQRIQPAGMIMANVQKVEEEKGGKPGSLTRVFSPDYPAKGPGGRPVVDRALKVLRSKPHGRFLLRGKGVLTIHPTDKDNPLGIKGVRGDLRLYLNPNDSLFYDAETYRKIYRDHPGEKPPDSDAGRASVIGHELGHRFEEFDENNGGRNVRDHENAVRSEQEIPLRRSYGGHQFRVEE